MKSGAACQCLEFDDGGHTCRHCGEVVYRDPDLNPEKWYGDGDDVCGKTLWRDHEPVCGHP